MTLVAMLRSDVVLRCIYYVISQLKMKEHDQKIFGRLSFVLINFFRRCSLSPSGSFRLIKVVNFVINLIDCKSIIKSRVKSDFKYMKKDFFFLIFSDMVL